MGFESIIKKVAKGDKVKVHIIKELPAVIYTGYVVGVSINRGEKKISIDPYIGFDVEGSLHTSGIFKSTDSSVNFFALGGLEIVTDNITATQDYGTLKRRGSALIKRFTGSEGNGSFEQYLKMARKL